jgi:hypothetical protein
VARRLTTESCARACTLVFVTLDLSPALGKFRTTARVVVSFDLKIEREP